MPDAHSDITAVYLRDVRYELLALLQTTEEFGDATGDQGARHAIRRSQDDPISAARLLNFHAELGSHFQSGDDLRLR